MTATFRGALAALAAIALAGCASTGAQSPTEAPSALASSASSPAATTPAPKQVTTRQVAAVVAQTKPQLMATMARYDDNVCDMLLDRGSPGLEKASCVADKLGIGRLASAMKMSLESMKPWPDEVTDLAAKTVKRLGSVELTAKDESLSSLFSSEKLFLKQHLQSWSAFGG